MSEVTTNRAWNSLSLMEYLLFDGVFVVWWASAKNLHHENRTSRDRNAFNATALITSRIKHDAGWAQDTLVNGHGKNLKQECFPHAKNSTKAAGQSLQVQYQNPHTDTDIHTTNKQAYQTQRTQCKWGMLTAGDHLFPFLPALHTAVLNYTLFADSALCMHIAHWQ